MWNLVILELNFQLKHFKGIAEVHQYYLLGISSSLVSESDANVSGSFVVSSSDVSDESGWVELARS